MKRLMPGQAVHRLMRGLLLLPILLPLAGCDPAGEGTAKAVDVVVSPGGRITVNDKAVALEDLSARLKAEGAGRQTTVRVKVPAGTSSATLRTLTSRLASAGYTRVIFSKPLRADASVRKR